MERGTAFNAPRGGGGGGRGGAGRGGSGAPRSHSAGSAGRGRGGGGRGVGGGRGGGGGAGRGGRGGGNQQQRSFSANSNSSSRGGAGGRGGGGRGRGGDRGSGGRGGFRAQSSGNTFSREAGAALAAAAASSSSEHQQPAQRNRSAIVAGSSKDTFLRQKASHDIRRDLIAFFARAADISFGSTQLDEVFALVPPSLFNQHVGVDLLAFKSYLPQFMSRAGKCPALGYVRWYEWASHMHQKLNPSSGNTGGGSSRGGGNNKNSAEDAPDADSGAKFRHDADREATKQATRARLQDAIAQREHMRALLAMCQRPSHAGRTQGVHALVNHVNDILRRKMSGAAAETNAIAVLVANNRINTIADVKDNIDASIAYALTRLVLGMASESFNAVCFNCVALGQMLGTFPGLFTPAVVLSLLDSELALTERMNVIVKRNDSITRRLERGEAATDAERAEALAAAGRRNNNNKSGDGDDDAAGDEGAMVVSESITDPTRGERQQKTMAALFTLVALWESRNQIAQVKNWGPQRGRRGGGDDQHGNNKDASSVHDIFLSGEPTFTTDVIRRIVQVLCYLYIEHHGTRLLSSSLLFRILASAPADALDDRTTRRWLAFTFFAVPEVQYLRPEGIHFLLLLQHSRIMQADYGWTERVPMAAASATAPLPLICGGPAYASAAAGSGSAAAFPKPIRDLVSQMDPLAPVALEQLAVALFRKDQVTAHHPLLHPVWDLFLHMIVQRCEQGESLHQHLSNFLHNVITPFRRGVTDIPRQQLFNELVRRVGRLALQSSDADERSALIDVANLTVGFGKSVTIGKETDQATLRRMAPAELEDKVVSLGAQLRALGSRPGVVRIRTWLMKELKACSAVPQFSTVLPTFVNNAFRVLFEFGFFTGATASATARINSGGDPYNRNKAVFLVAEAVTFRALASRKKNADADDANNNANANNNGGELLVAVAHANKGNKNRIAFTLDYCALLDEFLAKERATPAALTRFHTAKVSKPVRAARDLVEAALRTGADFTTRSVLFYKQRELVDGLLFLLFLALSSDDPQNAFVTTDLAGSVVPDLVRFLREGTLDSIALLFDVLMALSMRDSCPEQIAPLQLHVRKLALVLLSQFARFLSTKEDFDLVLSPLIDAFGVDLAQTQRQTGLDKKRKRLLAKTGVDAPAELGLSGAADDEDDDDEEEEEDQDGDDDDVESGNNKKKGAAAKDGATDEDDDGDDDEEGTPADTEEDNDDGDDDEASDEKRRKAFVDSDAESGSGDDDDEDAGSDDWHEEAPTAEYIAGLKALLKRSIGGVDVQEEAAAKKKAKKNKKAGDDNASDSDDDDSDDDAANELTLHTYAPVPANKAQTDAIYAINVATRITSLTRTPSALRTLQVFLAVMRETLKAPKSYEVFTAAHNAIETLVVSLPRFVGGSFLGERSVVLLSTLRDLMSYLRRLERTLVAEELAAQRAMAKSEENVLEGDNGMTRNPIEFAAFVKRNLGVLKQASLRVFHFAAFVAAKNNASEAVRLLFLEHYKSCFADRGWDATSGAAASSSAAASASSRILFATVKSDMFHFRHAFAWCLLDAAVEKAESLRFTNAGRRVRAYTEAAHFLVAFIPRLSRLPPSMLGRARAAILAFLGLFTPKQLFAMRATMLYEFVKTLQFCVEYARFTGVDTAWAASVLEEIVSDDDLRITAATRRALTKLERALRAEARAANIKQVEPFKALRRGGVAATGDAPQQQQEHHQSHRSLRAQQAVAAKRMLKDRAEAEGVSLEAAAGGDFGGPQSEARELQELGRRGGSAGDAPHKKHRSESAGSSGKGAANDARTQRMREEQRKKQEQWDQLSGAEKAAIRAKSQQAKQDRVASNKAMRREQRQARDQQVAQWKGEKLSKVAADDAN